MKFILAKYLMVIACLYSAQSFALNVDKMIIFTKKNQETATLTVSNPANYPVMFKVELGERNNDGTVTPLALENFDNWPAFLDRTEYFIDPKGEVEVNIRLIGKMMGEAAKKDLVLAIDVTPESINVESEDAEKQDNMAILMGYRTWLVLPKDGQVKGDISIVKEKGQYYVINNLDTVAFLNINACDTVFEKGTTCSGTEWVLAGKKKKLNFSAFKQGSIKVNYRDSFERYKKSQTIKL
ncbi:hypothetical protein [Vibrio owensii]|uniref:hypothetical protein n=1 Tax=Vibrio owensii TaxID=696485 RepID=UPI003AAF097C